MIAGWAAERVKFASATLYADKKDEIRAYIASAVKEAIENSDEISDLEKFQFWENKYRKTRAFDR